MKEVQNHAVTIDCFEKGNPMKVLLKTAYDLFGANQTGILYGTNHTRMKGLPTTAWDRGYVKSIYGKGLKGVIMGLFGTYILTAKKLNPIFSYIEDKEKGKIENYGIIPYLLRVVADYYKKGEIIITICPNLEDYIYRTDERYVDVPLYVYDGNSLDFPDVTIKLDADFARHFKSKNCIYAYLPDYGVLGINNSSPELMKTKNDELVNRQELIHRLATLAQLIEAATLARLDQIKGIKGVQLLVNKRKHLDTLSSKLRNSEEEYRNLYDRAPIAYLSMDPKGQVVNFNKKAKRLTGYKDRDLIQLNGKNIFPGLFKSTESGEDLLSHPDHEVIKNKEIQLITKKDATLWVSLSVEIIRDRLKKIVEYRAMFIDISQRKEVESQLLHKKKMESIGTLAGGLAHDLNNVLSPISTYAEVSLMETPETPEEKKYYETIVECAALAKNLVDQILTFSKQKGQAQNHPLNISDVLNSSRQMIRASLPSTIKLVISVEQDLPPILADPGQIHLVIMNLVANANHAMEKEKGSLNIRLLKRKLPDNVYGGTPMDQGYYVCLSVSDTGSGIPPYLIDKIFDPFFSTQNRENTSGIGLSVVYGIVDSHNGYIRVSSNENKGCRFDLFFPPYYDDKDQTNSQKLPDLSDEKPFIRKGDESILLVDDNTNVAIMHTHLLEKLGYPTTYYTDSVDALEHLQKDPYLFDCIITDYSMPDITGVDFSEHVKKLRSDIPVILYSGFGDAIDKQVYDSGLIQGFLKKPLTITSLSLALSRIFD